MAVISLFLLCSCSGSEKPVIPLLIGNNNGGTKNIIRASWDVDKEEIIYDEEKLFDIVSHISELFCWDGDKRLVFHNKTPDDISGELLIESYKSGENALLYYDNTRLEKTGDSKFELSFDKKSYLLDFNKAENRTDKTDVELEKCYPCAYIVKDNIVYILFGGQYSSEKESILMYMAKADYKTGLFELRQIDTIKLSPTNPPVYANVLQLDDEFIVFNDCKVASIKTSDGSSEVLITNDGIPKLNDGHPLFYRIGYFNGYLLIRANQWKKYSYILDFRLYLRIRISYPR